MSMIGFALLKNAYPLNRALQLYKQNAESNLWVFLNEKILEQYFGVTSYC